MIESMTPEEFAEEVVQAFISTGFSPKDDCYYDEENRFACAVGIMAVSRGFEGRECVRLEYNRLFSQVEKIGVSRGFIDGMRGGELVYGRHIVPQGYYHGRAAGKAVLQSQATGRIS